MATSPTPSLNDLAVLNAELAALVRARIPLESSLRRLGGQLPRGAGALAERLAERMEQGDSLAEAIEAEGDSLPPMYKAVVVAGLQAGNPAGVLQTVSDSAARLASLRQTVGIALIVPVVVICLASTLFGFLFLRAFNEATWIAPRSLDTLQKWSQSPTLEFLFVTLIPTLAILLPIGWWYHSRSARSISLPRWTLLGWIPSARRLHRLNASATLSEVLRMGVVAGMPWGDTLQAAGRASGNRRYQQAADAVADQLAKGKSLDEGDPAIAKPLKQLPLLVQVALRFAEHRPRLLASLDRASQSYLRRAEALHASLVGWVPAMLTLGVAGLVTFVYTLALVWPYTQMLKTMAEGTWK